MHSYPLDVFVITEENINDYSLPFVVDSSAAKFNWVDAERYCQDTYGTSLLSVHSQEEMLLIRLVYNALAPNDRFWIGLNDRKHDRNWEWSDMSAVDYTWWSPGEPNDINGGEDCAELFDFELRDMRWNDAVCDAERRPLCTNPSWSADETRTFQIHSEVMMEEVISVAVGNNDHDAICIDSVTVNEEEAKHYSSRWLSSQTTDIMMAVFKFPVCKSEVVDVRFDMESAKIHLSESSIAGIECKNYNRFAMSTCSIERSETFTTSTTISTEISEEYSRSTSSEFTIGTSRSGSSSTSGTKSTSLTESTSETESTSSTISKSYTASTSNELSLGTDIENEISSSATAGTNDIVVAQATITSKLSIKTSQQFKESSTDSKTTGRTGTIGNTNTEGSSRTKIDGLSKTKTGGLSETESYEST